MTRVFKNVIIIEGRLKDVLDLKEAITDAHGDLNPFKFFESLPDDEMISRKVFFDDKDSIESYKKEMQAEDDLFLNDKRNCYREKFQSFWCQSLNGESKALKRDHFQLVIEYESDKLVMNEWLSTSLRFPDLLFLLEFWDCKDRFDAEILIQEGEIYYKSNHSYFKDADGYSICLDGKMEWTYVMPPESKMKGKARKYVDPTQIIPLKEQMNKIEDPFTFFKHFPFELFISWTIDDDNYFLPRPNTIIHPDALPSPDVEPQADDFDM